MPPSDRMADDLRAAGLPTAEGADWFLQLLVGRTLVECGPLMAGVAAGIRDAIIHDADRLLPILLRHTTVEVRRYALRGLLSDRLSDLTGDEATELGTELVRYRSGTRQERLDARYEIVYVLGALVDPIEEACDGE